MTPAPFLLSWLSLGSPGTSFPKPPVPPRPSALQRLCSFYREKQADSPCVVSVHFPPPKYPCLTLYFQAQDRRSVLAHSFPSLRAPYPHPHPPKCCSLLQLLSPSGSHPPAGPCSVSPRLSPAPPLALGWLFQKPFLPVITRDCPTARPSGLFSVLITSLMSWRLSPFEKGSL